MAYNKMNQVPQNYDGEHSEAPGFIQTMHNMDLFRADSMDLTNDPRFFNDNVLDKRLGAFGGLSVVSGLMLGSATDQCFGMKKDFDMSHAMGYIQVIGFATLSVVLFTAFLATYIGVAQLYHTMRLMTGGPNGFEMAAGYYLNRNIVFWRHFSIKCMLWSLPLYLVSSGFRMIVKFYNDNGGGGPAWVQVGTQPTSAPDLHATVAGLSVPGICVACVYIFVAIVISWIHQKHMSIFKEKYRLIHQQTNLALLHHTHAMMTSGMNGRTHLDC